jgi:hypothetical protein
LSTTQNTRMAEAHGSLSITCSTSRPNGAMPVVAWQRPNSRALPPIAWEQQHATISPLPSTTAV